MQHGTSYSSTHSFKTLHFLFESRWLFIATYRAYKVMLVSVYISTVYINAFYIFISAVLGLLLYLYFSKKQASLFFIIAYEEYFLIVAFMKGRFIKSIFY